MSYTTVDQVCAMFPTFQRTAPWKASTPYIAGQTVTDSNNHIQRCTTAGTTASSAPTWNASQGNTTDGTVVWIDLGPSSGQKPSDAFIQNFIDDVTGDIDAVLLRRFSEAIFSPPSSGIFALWVNALPPQALNLLEKITRHGACGQLGGAFASAGIQSAKDTAKDYWAQYIFLLDRLDSRKADGSPNPSGYYDAMFDSIARIESPRPGLQYIAGGDQPVGQVAADIGLSNLISKFQVM